MSSLRLWSWHLSPFAGKVRVAMAHKGVACELIEVDPANRPARLRELNPSGRVPVLEIGETAVFESTVICEWLEETQPGPSLWPPDATARARARSLLRWVDDELTTPFFLSMRKEAFGLDPVDHPQLVDHLRDRLAKRWRGLERLLGAGGVGWLAGGSDPTLADLTALPLAVRLEGWRPDLAPNPGEHPAAAAWLARLRALPVAAEVDRRGTAPPTG